MFYRYDKTLYEYERGIHTKDVFTKDTYEATNFEQLMENLNKVSNKPKFDVKNNIKTMRTTNSCSIIEESIFGRK